MTQYPVFEMCPRSSSCNTWQGPRCGDSACCLPATQISKSRRHQLPPSKPKGVPKDDEKADTHPESIIQYTMIFSSWQKYCGLHFRFLPRGLIKNLKNNMVAITCPDGKLPISKARISSLVFWCSLQASSKANWIRCSKLPAPFSTRSWRLGAHRHRQQTISL